jgi:hypothetical protein
VGNNLGVCLSAQKLLGNATVLHPITYKGHLKSQLITARKYPARGDEDEGFSGH